MKKVKVKRLVGAFLAAALCLSLTACSGSVQDSEAVEGSTTRVMEADTKESEEQKETESTQASSPEESGEEESTQAPAATEEPTGKDREYKIKEFDIPDTEGIRFVRDMKIGWNLGNSFDAIDCNWLSDELDYESGWCGAKATPELIAALKEAGFNTIRIPVSWHNHLTDEDNYTISEAWLNRVNEVVDYCINEDLYVILNIHHDNSESYMYPSSQYLDQSVKYVTSIWSQLAERFRDYDEKLLFAGLNEPRLVGHNNEWWLDKNNADCKDAVACINTLNQTFVDTVRASGGNNASRYLICPGYAASADGVMNEGFVVPTDPVDNDHHIMVSVHAYTPYNFALESPGTDTWSSDNARNLSDMVGFMNNVYNKYVANGIPVIIDEFGAQEKNGNLEARVDFAGCYVAQARARGMSCIWWDNNVMEGNGERFGLINRRSLQWVFPEIVEAMMKYAE